MDNRKTSSSLSLRITGRIFNAGEDSDCLKTNSCSTFSFIKAFEKCCRFDRIGFDECSVGCISYPWSSFSFGINLTCGRYQELRIDMLFLGSIRKMELMSALLQTGASFPSFIDDQKTVLKRFLKVICLLGLTVVSLDQEFVWKQPLKGSKFLWHLWNPIGKRR